MYGESRHIWPPEPNNDDPQRSNNVFVWIVLQRIIIPINDGIIIFFRFHSLVMLVECWKNTYRRVEARRFETTVRRGQDVGGRHLMLNMKMFCSGNSHQYGSNRAPYRTTTFVSKSGEREREKARESQREQDRISVALSGSQYINISIYFIHFTIVSMKQKINIEIYLQWLGLIRHGNPAPAGHQFGICNIEILQRIFPGITTSILKSLGLIVHGNPGRHPP